MTDISTYYDHHPNMRPGDVMGVTDIRSWSTDCVCMVCKERKENSPNSAKFLYEEWDDFTLEYYQELSLIQYLLCPQKMPVFVFKSRSWGKYSAPNPKTVTIEQYL